MNKDINISEEQLNAFVDGELESEERSCLFNEAERSEELDQRICQQRKLKELIKHAYREVPDPKRNLPGRSGRSGILGLALAASLLLVAGITAGIFIRDFIDPSARPGGFAARTGPQTVAAAENYILHITSGDPEKMRLALQKAKELLSAAETGRPRQVEVVANEQGLDLLRSDVTPFSSEISALSNDNVIFYACSKAIHRLEEKGIKVQLVPEAIPGYSALDRVVIRMNDGWQYVKI